VALENTKDMEKEVKDETSSINLKDEQASFEEN